MTHTNSQWGTPEAHQLLQTFSTEHYRSGILAAYMARMKGLLGSHETKTVPTGVNAQLAIRSIIRTELPIVPHLHRSLSREISSLYLTKVNDQTGVAKHLGHVPVAFLSGSPDRNQIRGFSACSGFEAPQIQLLLDQVVELDDIGLKVVEPATLAQFQR